MPTSHKIYNILAYCIILWGMNGIEKFYENVFSCFLTIRFVERFESKHTPIVDIVEGKLICVCVEDNF